MKIVEFNDIFEAANLIAASKIIFIDTETEGFYGHIVLFQFSFENDENVYIIRNPNPELLANLLKDKHVVAYNVAYDISTIQQQSKQYDKFIPNFDCAFLLARLAYPELDSHSFDNVINYLEGKLIYDNKKEMQKSFSKNIVLSEEQLEYAAKDVYYLKKLWTKVGTDNLRANINYKIDRRTLYEAFKFQWTGMKLNEKETEKEINKLNKFIEDLDIPKSVNVNSYQQVRAYLGVNKSDALYLTELKLKGNEKSGNILAKRKALKKLSFIEKYLTLERNGYLYGKFSPSAKSGRFTSSDINQQQHPRELKHLFGFEEHENKVYIYSDYPQLELRTIAEIANDRRLKEYFENFQDPHGEVAKIIFGENFTKLQRYMAKTGNFGLLYGAGANTYREILLKQAEVLIPEIEAKRFKNKWLNIFTGIKQWQQNRIRDFHKNKLGCTPLIREYKATRIMDYLNIENQGAGAEVSKLALIEICNQLKEKGLDNEVKIANYIHDAYLLESPNEEEIYKEVAKIIQSAMIKGWEFVFKDTQIPMPVEVFVGYNWGKIEEDYIYKLSYEEK